MNSHVRPTPRHRRWLSARGACALVVAIFMARSAAPAAAAESPRSQSHQPGDPGGEKSRANTDAAGAETLTEAAAAAASPAGPPLAGGREKVVAALRAYAAALADRNLVALKQAWPSLTAVQQEKIGRSFRLMRSWRVDLVLGQIRIGGDVAVVSCLRKDEMVAVEGQTVRSHRRLDVRLHRTAAGWGIHEINE